jgi:alkylated DNA repair dioxygenase AlkB
LEKKYSYIKNKMLAQFILLLNPMETYININEDTANLLPGDGVALYYGTIFNKVQADNYYTSLLNGIEWQNDQAFIYGKLITTKRKVAWYGDKNFEYTYSKITKQALPWNKKLLELKTITENVTGESYNSCLLNLYHNGEEGMAWHSDAEKTLKENGAIASLSFGAERKFAFKHKTTSETVSLILQHGSLLLMKGVTQKNWLHRLPPTKQKFGPRINLTFRTIISEN